MKNLINKKIIKVLSILLVLGIISGIVFLFITSSLDKMIIKNEITAYIENINSKITLSTIWNSFKYNIIYFIIITISGVLYLFSPLIIFINYYKGMQIGFLLASLVYTYKSKGIVLSLASIIPHTICFVIGMIIYSSIIMNISYKLMKATYKEESINLKIFLKKIMLLLLISIIFSLITTALELLVNTYIMKLII